MRILIPLALLATLTGCYALMPVKYAANQVCGVSTERKAELADALDNVTFPHQLRVHCHAQED